MAGSLTIGGIAAGLLSGENDIGPVTMTGAALVGQRLDVTLVTGDNTLTVPLNAVGVVIVIASGNTSELKMRSNLNSSDGGTPFGPTGFAVWPLYTGTTSLIVNAASGGGQIEATFI